MLKVQFWGIGYTYGVFFFGGGGCCDGSLARVVARGFLTRLRSAVNSWRLPLKYLIHNTGFYVATNRGPAKELHSRMVDRQGIPRKGPGGNQIDMNRIIKKEMKGRLKVKVLDRDLFPWGSYFFYMG